MFRFRRFFLGWLIFDRVVDLRCWWILRSWLRHISLNGHSGRVFLRCLNLRFWCWRLHIFGILFLLIRRSLSCSFNSVDVRRRFGGIIFLRSTICHDYCS
jgi:hypothetical protein